MKLYFGVTIFECLEELCYGVTTLSEYLAFLFEDFRELSTDTDDVVSNCKRDSSANFINTIFRQLTKSLLGNMQFKVGNNRFTLRDCDNVKTSYKLCLELGRLLE